MAGWIVLAVAALVAVLIAREVPSCKPYIDAHDGLQKYGTLGHRSRVPNPVRAFGEHCR